MDSREENFVMAVPTTGDAAPRNFRYYHTARTAHLERQSAHSEAWLLYTDTRGDFDEVLAEKTPFVERVSLLGLLGRLFRAKADVIEVPEVFAIRLWPQLVVIHTFCGILRLIRFRPIEVVSYAIENYDPGQKLHEFTKLSPRLCRRIARIIGRYLIYSSSRIAFGTRGALDTYEMAIGSPHREWAPDVQLFPAIPTQKVDTKSSDRGANVTFIGTFENRKGIGELIGSWPHVVKAEPSATLEIMGFGPLVALVERAATEHMSVTFTPSPSRHYIFNTLSKSRTLVLLSQPARGWREQVGLPIVEGLENGCLIVSTDETGIASWLAEHGHYIVRKDASVEDFAKAIVASIRSVKNDKSVWADLSPRDGREVADSWIFGSADLV